MSASDIRNDVIFHNNVTFAGAMYPPSGAINNSHFSADANNRLAASKTVHRIDLHYGQANGADVVAAIQLLRVCRGAGTIVGISLRPTVVPAGGDKAYTVEVLKAADGSGSWSSLLDAVFAVDSADTANTKLVGDLIGTPTVAADEAIRVVVAVSGSTGTQGQGFTLSIYLEEAPS
jgi:hypothetical protein